MMILAVLVAPAFGETELVLIDGRVLRGTDVRRDGGEYVLTLESGELITLPAELVESIRLEGEREEEQEKDRGRVAGNPVPPGPTGLRDEEPETIAGRRVDPPTRSEQLEALGPPAEFRKDIIDNRWVPESDWDMDPEKNNNFNPSTWAESPIDPTWEPESAFDLDEDVLASSRSTWKKSIIDSTWTPTDGFKNSVGNR